MSIRTLDEATNEGAIPENMKNDKELYDESCSFCAELSGEDDTEFGIRYGRWIESRIVDEEEEFVAMPTFGQLMFGSLLVLPKFHCETMADLEPSQSESMLRLVGRVAATVKGLGTPMVYEHGAKKTSGGSCGIYHAHIHIVPLPSEIYPDQIFHDKYMNAESLCDGLHHLKGANEYLLLKIGDQPVAYHSSNESLWVGGKIGSQHVRKKIRDIYDVAKSWDWRDYDFEEDMIGAIKFFKEKHNRPQC